MAYSEAYQISKIECFTKICNVLHLRWSRFSFIGFQITRAYGNKVLFHSESKLTLPKTFGGRPRRLMKVLCMFVLCPEVIFLFKTHKKLFFWWEGSRSHKVNQQGIIHLAPLQNFPKNYHFLLPDLMRRRLCAY